MNAKRKWITVRFMLVSALLVAPFLVNAQQLQAGSTALTTRVAPGESVPLTVRLSNFGSSQRVDVSVKYEIFDSNGTVITSQSETVAVETSASYIKQILLPADIPPGQYTARTSIIYNGQLVPATASQQFTVERKIYGIFISDAITYSLILVAVAIISVLVGLLFRRFRKQSLFVRQDYSNIPENMRIYYEILSDSIQQMRYHEGDRAMDIIAGIPGLTVDRKSGKVLNISRDPADIVASVVSAYAKAFGKKLNLDFAEKERGYAIVR